MDMIPSAKLDLLMQQRAKFKQTKQYWFEDYNEEILEHIKGFIQSNSIRLTTNQFNIVPNVS